MDLLEYVESEAKANADFQIACRDALLKEVNTSLSGLFGGGVGALAYAVNLSEKPHMQWAAWGMAVAGVYLFAVALGVVARCLKTQQIWPPGNDPGLLLDAEELEERPDDVGLRALRMANLRSKQRSIERNRACNERVALWLDRFRFAALAVPLVFAIAAGVVGVVC